LAGKRRTLLRRRGPIWLLALMGFFGVAFVAAQIFINDADLPWKPLSADDRVGLATNFKLRSFKHDQRACRAFLREAGVTFIEIPPRKEGEFCALNDVVRIDGGLGAFTPAARPMMTCPMAAGVVLWRRKVIEPAAASHFGPADITIEHLGTYSCRRQYHRRDGPPSEHAFANAFDVSGFRVGKTRVVVETDWEKDGKKSAFLRDVHRGACRIFDVTLGPDFNAAHDNHFHVDMGPWVSCR
jgi:hypothetical protein